MMYFRDNDWKYVVHPYRKIGIENLSYWNQHITKSKLALVLPCYYEQLALADSCSVEKFALSITTFREVYTRLIQREFERIEGHIHEESYKGRITKVDTSHNIVFELQLSAFQENLKKFRNTPIYL